MTIHTQFQSTLPVWGATGDTRKQGAYNDISIHTPRVGSDLMVSSFLALYAISIHTPRVGSDRVRFFCCAVCRHFNPHSPCGERHRIRPTTCSPRHFNPHSPCGERPCGTYHPNRSTVFQSTLPVWGATTSAVLQSVRPYQFQSTLPVWGATIYIMALQPPTQYFNPHSPCGERRGFE